MKKIIPIILLFAFACDDEPNTNLSGEWIFVEPPSLQSRINRNDTTIPAFDVVFEIQGEDIVFTDLLLDGIPVAETATMNHHGETADITIEADGFNLVMTGCRRANAVILAGTVTYTLPSGGSKTYKGLSIAQYIE
jgi:hypothetical protein